RPAQIVKQAPNVPLTTAQREVAGKFILTAVARKNLAVAYNLVTDTLKQGLTLKQWQSGNIPVVPFDVGAGLVAPMHVLYSHPRSAELQILLLPKHGKGQFFILVLKAAATEERAADRGAQGRRAGGRRRVRLRGRLPAARGALVPDHCT